MRAIERGAVFSFLTVFVLRAALAAAPEQVPGDWLARVAQQIRAGEYDFSEQPDGSLSAPNRSHDLRSIVDPRGVGVESRTRGREAFHLRLALTGWGRPEAMLPAGAGELRLEGGRASVARQAGIEERFVNDERGLRHEIRISSPPIGGTGPLTLSFAVGGSVLLFGTGEAGFLATDAAAGPVLRCSAPSARDGSGRDLPARLRIEPGRVLLEIEDEAAAFPLTVSVSMTSPAWSAESNQPSASFGYSVATAGDVDGDGHSDVIVGAYQYDNGQPDEGRAYVFLGSASGLAATAASIVESNQAGAEFGISVSAAGDVDGDGHADVIVGAHRYDNGQNDEGRAYVYRGSAAGLVSTSAWTAEGNQAGSEFGWAVSGAGDANGDGFSDVMVGAFRYDNGETDEGRAFLYLGSATGLAATPAWTAEGGQEAAGFAYSVATAGDVNGDGRADAIVGAIEYDNEQIDEGRALVFLGSASGLGTTPAWTAESDQAMARFGSSVATAGDVNGDGYSDVIVGAIDYDNEQIDEGRAYVFLGSAAGPAGTSAWTAESDQAFAHFGSSVSTAGDVNGDGFSDVVAGAYLYDNGQTDEGRVYVYLGSSSGPVEPPAWTAESDQASARFGSSVSTAGDVDGDGYAEVIVGAPRYDAGQTDEGRAFVYSGSGVGLRATAAWTGESDQAEASFGYSVSTAGDVNGDGFSDVIVGAPGFDNGQADEGRAYVYTGSPSGLVTVPSWTAEGNQAGASFGSSVATAGDVNGDGFSDVIVGASLYDDVRPDAGRAAVYLGSSSGLDALPDWIVGSGQANAHFGHSVATAGDVNGDGYSDVIVGANLFSNAQSFEGRAFVFLGSNVGLAPTPAWTAESNQAAASFASSVATAGDVNGDGYSDVIVGAPAFDNGQASEGRAFVYLGSPAGLPATPAWIAESDQSGAELGSSVATAGDVNGDGYSDVIVGAHQYDDRETNEGRAYVFLGAAAGPGTVPAWTAESAQAGASFGASVATAGDVNGDGYSDVIVGADRYDNGETGEGRATVYLGSASGLATAPGWIAEGDQVGAALGASASSAGDVNGDGFSDVIVGAGESEGGQAGEGRAFLFFGGGGDGLDRTPRQARADGSAPIDLLGAIESGDSLRLRAVGRTPAGRGIVRLEWELKPLGTPFTGTGLELSAEVDTGVPMGSLGSRHDGFDEIVSGLLPSGVFRWRVRIASDDPRFPRSRWLVLPGNNVTETDVRTIGCFEPPVDAIDIRFQGPAGDETTLSWSPDPDAVRYDAVRGELAFLPVGLGGAAEVCFGNLASPTLSDPAVPAVGSGYFYVVRGENSCGAGSYGNTHVNPGPASNGPARTTTTCP